LVYYRPDIGLRTWKIVDLTAEHQQSNRYELIVQAMTDGWAMGQDDEPLFLASVEHRKDVYVLLCRVVIEGSQTSLDFSSSRFGKKWTDSLTEVG